MFELNLKATLIYGSIFLNHSRINNSNGPTYNNFLCTTPSVHHFSYPPSSLHLFHALPFCINIYFFPLPQLLPPLSVSQFISKANHQTQQYFSFLYLELVSKWLPLDWTVHIFAIWPVVAHCHHRNPHTHTHTHTHIHALWSYNLMTFPSQLERVLNFTIWMRLWFPVCSRL